MSYSEREQIQNELNVMYSIKVRIRVTKLNTFIFPTTNTLYSTRRRFSDEVAIIIYFLNDWCY